MLETSQEYDVVICTATDYNPDGQNLENTNLTEFLFFRPLGAYRMRTFLETKGIRTKVIDFCNILTKEQIRKLVDKYVSKRTKFLCLSGTFLGIGFGGKKGYDPMYNLETKDVVAELDDIFQQQKSKYNNLKVLVGGARASFIDLTCADYFINSYGEKAFLDLYNDVTSDSITYKGKKIIQGIQNMSHETYNTIFKPEDGIDHEIMTIEVSRGCIFKCAFCNFPLNGKKQRDYIRDVESLKDEIQYNYETFGVDQYILADDTFNDSIYKLEQLLPAFESTPIKFATYIKPELLISQPDQVDILVEMGLVGPSFGIESLNPLTRKSVQKGFTYEKIQPALVELKEKALKRHGHYNSEWNLIVGLPHETNDESKKNAEYLYNSYECDGITWRALGINNRSVNTGGVPLSPIELDPGKYGYKVGPMSAFIPDAPIHDDFMYWMNDTNNSNYVKSLATTLELQKMEIEQGYVSSFYMMNAYNCGFDYRERSMKRSSFGEKELLNLRSYIRAKVDDYYEKQICMM